MNRFKDSENNTDNRDTYGTSMTLRMVGILQSKLTKRGLPSRLRKKYIQILNKAVPALSFYQFLVKKEPSKQPNLLDNK